MLVTRSIGSELTSSSGMVVSIWLATKQLRTKISLNRNIRLKCFVINVVYVKSEPLSLFSYVPILENQLTIWRKYGNVASDSDSLGSVEASYPWRLGARISELISKRSAS